MIDYENIAEKLLVGDKVLIDYGGVVLTVIGFESEEKYLINQLRKKKYYLVMNMSLLIILFLGLFKI